MERLCFNPLSTGHARVPQKSKLRIRVVSIPYLRVTHLKSFLVDIRPPKFQSPIYGSRTRCRGLVFHGFGKFQSPIYGSRTDVRHLGFLIKLCFNPLSTGHAPVSSSRTRRTLSSFNPLSTGHALTHSFSLTILTIVSIPYLRVTHDAFTKLTGTIPRFQSPIYGSRTSTEH